MIRIETDVCIKGHDVVRCSFGLGGPDYWRITSSLVSFYRFNTIKEQQFSMCLLKQPELDSEVYFLFNKEMVFISSLLLHNAL